jgi:hypothetical protein
MHEWEETHIKDLFRCKCGLLRYLVVRQSKFKVNAINQGLPNAKYVYSNKYYSSCNIRVSFRQWWFIHDACPYGAKIIHA